MLDNVMMEEVKFVIFWTMNTILGELYRAQKAPTVASPTLDTHTEMSRNPDVCLWRDGRLLLALLRRRLGVELGKHLFEFHRLEPQPLRILQRRVKVGMLVRSGADSRW
jgi:hypothetical protein